MGTPENLIPELFSCFQINFNEEQAIRDEIREIVKGLDQMSREIMTLLQTIHLESGQSQIADLTAKGRAMLGDTAQMYDKLKSVVPKGEYYRYNDHWRNSTQKLVFLVALITFLESGQLVKREEAAAALGICTAREEGFHLDLEDYLSGLLLLTSELSRFAVNSVTSGDYSRPLQISRFVNELNSGFRLLNFRNDGLRKRYDGLKYDLKKIEEIVYDLSIRGLAGQQSQAAQAGEGGAPPPPEGSR